MNRALLSAALWLLASSSLAQPKQDRSKTFPEEIRVSNELEELLEQTNEIAKDVVKGRGLKLLKPLEKKPIRQAEVRRKLVEEFGKDFKPGELESEELTLKKLGFMKVSDDYRTILIDVLTEQIAGFYDTDEKALFLVEEILPDRGALAHEICHALQDQNFDLNKLQEARKDAGGDASLALAALIEGDAMGVLIDDGLNWRGSFANVPDLPTRIRESVSAPDEKSQVLDAAPPLIKESLIFPYLDGLSFVYALRQKGTWKVIDDAFADPPSSTEQILHPERYIKRDEPSQVPLFSLPSLGRTHASFYDNVFGELQLRIWFEQALSETAARDAAAGWDGDRFVAFAPKRVKALDLKASDLDSVVIAAISTWDSENDAKEAEAAFLKVSQSLLPGSSLLSGGVVGYSDKPWAGQALVIREKNAVLYVFGVSAPVLSSLGPELRAELSRVVVR